MTFDRAEVHDVHPVTVPAPGPYPPGRVVVVAVDAVPFRPRFAGVVVARDDGPPAGARVGLTPDPVLDARAVVAPAARAALRRVAEATFQIFPALLLRPVARLEQPALPQFLLHPPLGQPPVSSPLLASSAGVAREVHV